MMRRTCLKRLATAAVAAATPGGFAYAQQQELLKEAAARVGLRYGANPYAYPPAFAPAYDRLVVEQCSMIAPNLSWSLVEPRPRAFRTDADLGVVSFARANRLALTGYCLLWYYRNPKWFEALDSRQAAEQAITLHIADMGARYADASWSVNVLNEPLQVTDGRPDGLRSDAFARLFGDSYWGIAFNAARRAFPRSLLVYNETFMEQDHRGGLAARRKALLGRLDAARAAATPIHAVGLQAHLTLSQAFDQASWGAFLDEIAARGLKIVITELDVLDIAAPADIAARDQAVADMYRRFLEPTLDRKAVVGVVTWGVSDRYSWLVPASSAGFARPDGLPIRALPFDAELRPKPAYTALLKAFQSAPARPAWQPA